MMTTVGEFENHSFGQQEKFDWRKQFLPIVESISNRIGEDEYRHERWVAGNRETALNIIAPTLAALGHEPSKRRVEHMEKHGVVGIAEKLAKNYRIDDFKFGANMQELTRSVVSKPGRKFGMSNVSLRNLASKHAGLITGELLTTHPNTLRKQIEKGDVDPLKGVVVEVAHEIARLSVIHKRMSSSGGDLYREFRKVENRIRKLVDIGQAAINGDFSEEVMKGGLPALEAAVKSATKKRTRTLASLGLVVGSTVLAACGGNNAEPQKATQVVGGGDQPITVETPIVAMSPTVESTPVSIVIPVPTSTSPVIEIAVGEPIPNIDFEAVPAYVPEASNPVNDVLIPNQVDALRDHGLSVLHSAGFVAYQDANGVEYFPALDEITAASGDAALKKGEMDKNGVLTYKSEDGKTIEHHLLSFDCPDNELCYEVLSFNEEDPGILYLVRVDKATGKVVAHVNTGVAGEAVANGKDIPWQTGESEYWQSSVTGEAALQRGDVKAKSYENGVLTFLDDAGKEHSVDDDDISFYPGFGTVVTDNDGWYTWNDVSDSWVLMSQADAYGGTQLVNGEVIYNVDGKYAIADDNNYYWVEGVEEGDKLTVVTQDGKRWGWDEAQGWVEEVPIKEFPWCNDFSKFLEFPVEFQDLQEQGRFVQSELTEEMLDPSKFNPVDAYSIASNKYLIPNIEKAPHYVEPGSAPFLKNVMCGTTQVDGETFLSIQVPYYIEGVDPKKWPVITGLYLMPEKYKGAWKNAALMFQDKMNLVPWDISEYSYSLRAVNPATGVNFTLSEIKEIVKEMKNGDFSHTNGLIFKFDIGVTQKGWYQ